MALAVGMQLLLASLTVAAAMRINPEFHSADNLCQLKSLYQRRTQYGSVVMAGRGQFEFVPHGNEGEYVFSIYWLLYQLIQNTCIQLIVAYFPSLLLSHLIT